MKRMMCFLLLAWLLVPQILWGQTSPENACKLRDGQLVFTLDNRWNVQQRIQVVKLFDLDSALVASAIKGEIPNENKDVWSIKRLDANRVELFKKLKSSDGLRSLETDVTLLDDRWITPSGITERESVPYGINLFTRFDVFSYNNGIARFYLPGRQDARQVFLSGTFNGWSTSRSPMQKTDSGWIAHVRLKPGKYLYKYIVDGRWSPDPYNRQKEDDLNGDYNSIVFCYNFTFRLAGYQGAQNVWVAGSFNGWNNIELRMQRINNSWIRGMYLREGTHAYKFIVDKTWILDPANKVVREDGSGNENSFISIGDTMYFRLAGFPNAKKVVVTGNFNGWNESELVMQKINGGWELPYVLRPGNYEYKFICDGKWMPDPANPYNVGSGDFTNSIITIKPNHLFVLTGKSYARVVTVAGTFNGWNSKSYKMIYKDGRWTFPLYLSPGKHLYKFVVDDKWILDPDNKLWEENEYGTGNSILWIE